MMKAEERIMVSQRKVAVEWIIPKKFLFPFLEKKKKEQCRKLCSVGSKVELLRCTVQDCTQWFNCTVILRVCICVCALVRVIAESCYTRSRLTLINQCRVLFRDMASSRPVNPPSPTSPRVKTAHTSNSSRGFCYQPNHHRSPHNFLPPLLFSYSSAFHFRPSIPFHYLQLWHLLTLLWWIHKITTMIAHWVLYGNSL